MGKLAAVKSLCWREGKRETPPNKLQRITTKKKNVCAQRRKTPRREPAKKNKRPAAS